MSHATVAVVALSALALPARTASAAGWAYTMSTVVSANASGSTSNDESRHSATNPVLSTDGRFVVFSSAGTNLVVGDTNGQRDVFVKDRATGAVDRISVGTAGAEADGASLDASISGDGRYVAFASHATNLVAGDTNGVEDVFVRDRVTRTTTRLSVSDQGVEADADSDRPSISPDGNWVAFESDAHNLVPGDGRAADVFVASVHSRAIELISVGETGPANGASELPRLSADGRYVEFQSDAANLVPADTNNVDDVFLRDRTAQTTERVAEVAIGAAISADGGTIAFMSPFDPVSGTWNNLDVFVLNRTTGSVSLASVDANGVRGNDQSWLPAISGDGRFVTFTSEATNLDAIDTDPDTSVFVHDTVTGGTRFVARRTDGTKEPGPTYWSGISADGNIVVANQGDRVGRHEDQVWQVHAWHRDGTLQLVCIFVDVVRCERQITNGDERLYTTWEINRKMWRDYDNQARIRFVCRPGEEVTVRVVMAGTKDNRRIEATVTSHCVRGNGG
jgi:Tol biopolymer transport system component